MAVHHTFGGKKRSKHSNVSPSNWDQIALNVHVMLCFDKVFNLEDILLSVYSTSSKYQQQQFRVLLGAYCWLTMQLWGDQYCSVSILSFVLWHKKIKTSATPQDLQKKIWIPACALGQWLLHFAYLGNFLPVLSS